jgi:transcriptional regulator with XRE-family HTH domain
MKLADWLTQNTVPDAAFAETIGVSRQALWRYKADERMPRPAILSRIREATGGSVTADDFLPTVEVSAA